VLANFCIKGLACGKIVTPLKFKGLSKKIFGKPLELKGEVKKALNHL
jgi:hypothetical protein